MTLRPGATSSESSSNEHAWAEQWLYVVSGTGVARIGRRSVKLREGSLLLIARREPHVIENRGRSNLVTINVYVPPAYGSDGEPLPGGSRSKVAGGRRRRRGTGSRSR